MSAGGEAGPLIRPLAAGDEAEWRDLWEGYLRFYGTQRPEAVYAATWARLLSGEAGEFRGLIARPRTPEGGEGPALGITHYLFHRHCWSVADVVYLQDLYVAETARGLGAGRALIEAVYAAADAAGADNVYWLTQTGNARARGLYDQLANATDFMKYARR